MENYRYIKSTAEATIPNFILLYISFMIVAFLIAQGAAYSLFTPHLHGIHQDKKIITHEIPIFNGITKKPHPANRCGLCHTMPSLKKQSI